MAYVDDQGADYSCSPADFADNCARVFVVLTCLTFGEPQIIGGVIPNLIAFVLLWYKPLHLLQTYRLSLSFQR